MADPRPRSISESPTHPEPTRPHGGRRDQPRPDPEAEASAYGLARVVASGDWYPFRSALQFMRIGLLLFLSGGLGAGASFLLNVAVDLGELFLGALGLAALVAILGLCFLVLGQCLAWAVPSQTGLRPLALIAPLSYASALGNHVALYVWRSRFPASAPPLGDEFVLALSALLVLAGHVCHFLLCRAVACRLGDPALGGRLLVFLAASTILLVGAACGYAPFYASGGPSAFADPALQAGAILAALVALVLTFWLRRLLGELARLCERPRLGPSEDE